MSVMTDDQNASESAKHADSQSLGALCQACREPIQPGAKICPHCASPQARRRWWHTTSVVLKWVGATSAILSLLALSIQLGEIFQDSRKTRTSVKQLVQAADRLAKNNDHSGAMEMLDEALRLDPGDPDTRKLQVKVAMRQLQQYVHPVDRRDWEIKPLIPDNMGNRGKSKRQKLKSLIPKIRKGIGHQNPRTAADVLAHLGWAYRLGRTPYATVFNLFEDAFSLDPKNVFANTFWGGTCVEVDWVDERLSRACGEQRKQRMATAADHFRLAFDENREQDLVARIAFENLLEPNRGAQGVIQALVLAKYLVDKGSDSACKYGWELVGSMRETMDHGDAEASLLQRLSAAELLKLIEAIVQDPEDKRYTDDIMMARLIALTGDARESVDRLKRLRLRVRSENANSTYMNYIDETIIRTLGLKTGVMGIEVEPDEKGDTVSFGATLKQVMANGPGERAGLKQGDKIVAVGDVRVRTGYAMLDYLETFLPGNKIMLTILRQNSEKQIEVTLGPGGDPKKFGLNLYKTVNRHFYECVDIDTGYGLLHVMELNQEFRSAYNLGNDIEGVIVLEEHASSIQNCRLTSGDVISEANSRKIRTPEDLKKVFRAAVDEGVERIPIVISEAKGIRRRSFFVR